MSTVLYEEGFNEDIINILRGHKYWVFAWNVIGSTDIIRNIREIRNRIVNIPDGIKITCFKDDKDYTFGTLNPRTELRLENYKMEIGKTYKITNWVKFPHSGAGFEFLQVMVSNPSRPTIQLEVRNDMLGVRFMNPRGQLQVVPICPIETDKFMKWEVELNIHPTWGFFNVYKDGVKLWSYGSPTLIGSASNAWVQFGVYRNSSPKTPDQSIIYRYLKLEQV